MFLLQIPRLLLPKPTGTPFSNNWYVSTAGFPSAVQLKVITEPWHMVGLLTVNLNFSGLSTRFKSEMESYSSLECKRHSDSSKIVRQIVLLYKLQTFITIFSHMESRNCTWLWQFTITFYMFDFANQLPIHHLPFTPFCQGDERLTKHSQLSIQGCSSNFLVANKAEMLK